MRRRALPASVVAVLLAFASAPVRAVGPLPAGACQSLASLALPDTTIRSAEEVAGPSFTPPGAGALRNLPAFCRVVGVVPPAVNFEVWLPSASWNGKFQGVGNGGTGGSISYGPMAEALRRGYATASTDTGHVNRTGRDGSWAVGHPELIVDFAYRAVHETAVRAKALVEKAYREPAKHSFFVSCSTGGRQALMEAQRFPDDYDGIIAGDPAINWTHLQIGGHFWVASAVNKDPESYIPASKLPVIGNAVNAACDALDGIVDGVLDDPRKCKFNPETLVCAAGQDPASCLTPKQAKAVKDIWSGPHNASGALIFPPYMPGAEAAGGWAVYTTGTGPRTGNHWDQGESILKSMVFENPGWDFRTFDWDRDVAIADAKLRVVDGFDPDLRAFQSRGGKLLLYHGWNDPSISPLNTIDYYGRVAGAMHPGLDREQAEEKTQEFARLFMVPGMLHCTGGPGPSRFDMVTELEHWTEEGRAPERVIASHSTNGIVDRTRPLCVYPKVAVHNGQGSTDEAANFVCRAPGAPPGTQ